MIEVEKQFVLNREQKQILLTNAVYKERVSLNDIYYDTSDYSLIKKGSLLRNRNGIFEFKRKSQPQKSESKINSREELTTEQEIIKALSLKEGVPLKEQFETAGFKKIIQYATERDEYIKESFKIDVDTLSFGYESVEIELLVSDVDQIELANERIDEFVKRNNIDKAEVGHGKRKTYIKKFLPELWAELKNNL